MSAPKNYVGNMVSWEAARLIFDTLPLVVEGQSKIIRTIDSDTVIVRLKPTLFSHTANRAAIVDGTDSLRLRISQHLWSILARADVRTTILYVGSDYYVSRRVTPPPIEVIVKAALVGTPKHIYKNLSATNTRFSGRINPDHRHAPYVRFDWRNPLPHRDECMPLWLADQFIDTAAAEATALKAFSTLVNFLSGCEIELLDICFFITASGEEIFGEVSPDCMRVKHSDRDLDKDLWRTGQAPDTVRKRWEELLMRISTRVP